MFKHLKEKQVILVTGPQRSGTRFIAKAIAHDTGHAYIDEAEIKTDSTYEIFWQIHLKDGPNYVIQCPGLCYIAPALITARHDFFLVMCMRNIDDIIKSQKRIKWPWEWLERLKYENSWGNTFIAEIKYVQWNYEKEFLSPDQYLEVQYEDMKAHPLWVPKKQRECWGFSQTEVLEENKSCS